MGILSGVTGDLFLSGQINLLTLDLTKPNPFPPPRSFQVDFVTSICFESVLCVLQNPCLLCSHGTDGMFSDVCFAPSVELVVVFKTTEE